jgi:hypothetical protein
MEDKNQITFVLNVWYNYFERIIMDTKTIIQYILIAIILIIILLAVLKASKKGASLNYNKLVELLGGKDNIISTEINMSRFKVTLKDVTKANKEGIQKLGAKGIVEIDNTLKIILGKESKQFKKYLDELK